MSRVLSDSVLSLLYPQACGVCCGEVDSSDDGDACFDCWNATRIFNGSEALCNKCGAFLFEGRNSGGQVRCGRCDEHSYDRAFAIGVYERALSASIIHLKRTPRIATRLKTLLTATMDRIPLDGPTIVVPVPLSTRRQRERGFNQAATIGLIIAKHVGLALDEKSLIRKVHTPMHRAGMDKKARAMTVKNAFAVVRPNLIERFHVILVDDIFTSGETASNCSRVLKESGAATVSVLTIAHAA